LAEIPGWCVATKYAAQNPGRGGGGGLTGAVEVAVDRDGELGEVGVADDPSELSL
jgi:hypothetical protein